MNVVNILGSLSQNRPDILTFEVAGVTKLPRPRWSGTVSGKLSESWGELSLNLRQWQSQPWILLPLAVGLWWQVLFLADDISSLGDPLNETAGLLVRCWHYQYINPDYPHHISVLSHYDHYVRMISAVLFWISSRLELSVQIPLRIWIPDGTTEIKKVWTWRVLVHWRDFEHHRPYWMIIWLRICWNWQPKL